MIFFILILVAANIWFFARKIDINNIDWTFFSIPDMERKNSLGPYQKEVNDLLVFLPAKPEFRKVFEYTAKMFFCAINNEDDPVAKALLRKRAQDYTRDFFKDKDPDIANYINNYFKKDYTEADFFYNYGFADKDKICPENLPELCEKKRRDRLLRGKTKAWCEQVCENLDKYAEDERKGRSYIFDFSLPAGADDISKIGSYLDKLMLAWRWGGAGLAGEICDRLPETDRVVCGYLNERFRIRSQSCEQSAVEIKAYLEKQ